MCLGNNISGIGLNALHICQGQMTQEFNITLGTLHRREGQTQDLKAQTMDQGNKVIQNHLMDLRLANDALLADIFLTCLKLGLDPCRA